MESDFFIKFAVPIVGVVVSILGSGAALLTFWQRQKAHRLALAEKLYFALRDDSRLLAMEAFYQLTGLRYRYSDIKIMSEDNDALQRLMMLKRRKDAVTFSGGEYNYKKHYLRASKSISYVVSWVFFIASLFLILITIVMLFVASLIGKFVFTYVIFLVASILLCVYSASEIYWYREADSVLKFEAEKRNDDKEIANESDTTED